MEREQSVAERLELDRKREKKEELQSTASDEGVLVKASSIEELEERDFQHRSRRDSEYVFSSGYSIYFTFFLKN